MPKITVIVPVYNAERYLNESINSLINQTFKDTEILCIDDGSTDSSLTLLKEFAQKDNRIKVFTQENQGPSCARNLGLKNATGEYIVFVDADDWISEDMCKTLYEKAVSTNADIILFPFFQVNVDNIFQDDRLEKLQNNIPKLIFQTTDNIENIVEFAPVEAHGKFYKASLIKENNIIFPEDIRLGEDMCFFYTICMLNANITILNKAFYYYRTNTANSLMKKNDAIKVLYELLVCIEKRLLKSNFKEKREFLYCVLKRMSNIIHHFWNNPYIFSSKKMNFKYLENIYKKYKKIPHEEDDIFVNLKRDVFEYKFYFLLKFLQPIIEIEIREIRFVIYLFGKQVLNMPNSNFKKIKYNFYYTLLLWKLRVVSKFRKIRVGFWVTESSKWTNLHFYNELKNDKHFEPFILLSYFKRPQGKLSPKEYYKKLKEKFENDGTKVYETFDAQSYSFQNLLSFKPDIIFYQQPWLIDKNQRPEKTHKKALLCYIPYCFYSMNSFLNYLANFHGKMWKYFVETDLHKKEYETKYKAKNCIVTGSTKLDGYHFIDDEEVKKYKKDPNKKLIMYAPHHSFNDGLHEVATFKENGQFILELAKSHPDTEWIFRPHPLFFDRIIKNSIMTKEEINQYYKEWENIGRVSLGGNYYEMLAATDVMITDCISFLAEYAPTGNPVFHLKKSYQKEEFNSLVSKLDEGYYQIYSNEELSECFERVIINNDDYLKEKRELNKKLLPIDTLASKNIYNHLKKELWI